MWVICESFEFMLDLFYLCKVECEDGCFGFCLWVLGVWGWCVDLCYGLWVDVVVGVLEGC